MRRSIDERLPVKASAIPGDWFLWTSRNRSRRCEPFISGRGQPDPPPISPKRALQYVRTSW